jgi:hypothetical protein
MPRGVISCIEIVIDNIDINSTDNEGKTPIIHAMNGIGSGTIDVTIKFLLDRGANLFVKDIDGRCAIEMDDGPRALELAKDLRFESIKDFLILSKLSGRSSPKSVIQVLGCSDLVELIGSFILRVEIFIHDPEDTDDDDEEEKEPDFDVKRRLEAGEDDALSDGKRAREK